MSLKKILLIAASLLLISSTATASISCDKTSVNVKAENGKWGYAPVICHTTSEDITASYSGNISEKVEVSVIEKEDNDYIITIIADCRELVDDYFKGKISVYDDEEDLLISLPVSIRIGEGDEPEISVSEDAVRFTFTKLNYGDCYTVEIKNTGTEDLNNLRAKNTIYENNNISWITINDISEDQFEVGDEKDLKICVNNYDNFTGWTERETTIKIETDEADTEVKVRLSGDWELEIQKKYDQLFEQHAYLEKAYSQTRTYKSNYESLNNECGKYLENYSVNDSDQRNLTACPLLIEKYGNVTKEFYNITQAYETLKRNQSLLVNITRQQNISSKGNETAYLAQLASANAQIQELTDAVAEKDTTIILLNSKQKKIENQTNNSLSIPLIGNVIKSESTTPYIIAPVLLILAAATYLVIRRRKKASASKKAGMEELKAATPVLEETPALSEMSPETDREAQKAALRKLLLEKLAEKESK